ncbi:hypothetical protein [Streptomyces sp. CBMA156]|uniref:hypothetical protein n=1 Tax=Streptomyces sp. CBMA156 TaxID=1930280 RepID=UPI001661CDC8|nr:hypothetical protein [Streptomyces sp. CBMA156]MBD0674590.1 hypothetical protein [Streptomyces sp. CBMA156]
MNTAVSYAFDGRSAVFAGADVCREAALGLPDTVRRPLFEDDVWDFTEVVGLPVHMARKTERSRLQNDYDRALRVVAEIDAATLDQADEDSA